MAKKEVSVNGNKITVKGDYAGIGELGDIVARNFGSDVSWTFEEYSNGAVITVTNKRKDNEHKGPSKKR